MSLCIFLFYIFINHQINAITVPPLGSSPLPTLNLGCPDDTEGIPDQEKKFLNETCVNDTECFSETENSMACKNGRCLCNDGFLPEKRRTTDVTKRRLFVCSQPPSYGSPCSGVCQVPYKCIIPPEPIDLRPTTPGTIDLPLAEQTGKFCLCPHPYKYTGSCWLDCKHDEFYDTNSFKCKKRCNVNEIQADDGQCKRVSILGQACESKRQCITAFAVCTNGVCLCADGFSANDRNDICETKGYNCPTGSPLIDNHGSRIQCGSGKPSPPSTDSFTKKPRSTSPKPAPASPKIDQCPDTHFCILTTGEGDTAFGHCCPKPKSKCPIGDPHSNASCDLAFSCPGETHQCLETSLYGISMGKLCCPRACSSSQVFANGKCYDSRQYGDTCEIDGQCERHQGVCDQGICTCKKGYAADGLYSICIRQCIDYETLIDDQCVPLLKLDDPCDPNGRDLCPINAHCSRRKKTCVCECGYGRLDARNCAPMPTCNFTEQGTQQPTPTDEFNITGFTFCQIPKMSKVIANAVRECPKGRYCAQYQNEVGVCCPRPEKALCPDGTAPKSKCDPSVPKACGGKGYCYQYLNIAAPKDVTDGHICCYNQ